MSGEFKEDRQKITCPSHVPDSSEASKASCQTLLLRIKPDFESELEPQT